MLNKEEINKKIKELKEVCERLDIADVEKKDAIKMIDYINDNKYGYYIKKLNFQYGKLNKATYEILKSTKRKKELFKELLEMTKEEK